MLVVETVAVGGDVVRVRADGPTAAETRTMDG
jgi:hypothetical protein